MLSHWCGWVQGRSRLLLWLSVEVLPRVHTVNVLYLDRKASFAMPVHRHGYPPPQGTTAERAKRTKGLLQ